MITVKDILNLCKDQDQTPRLMCNTRSGFLQLAVNFEGYGDDILQKKVTGLAIQNSALCIGLSEKDYDYLLETYAREEEYDY